MILLDDANNALAQTLREKQRYIPFHATYTKSEPSLIDAQVSDFDGVNYHVSTPESKATLLISMKMQCFPELEQYGVQDELKAIYGDLLVEPEQGYQVSLKVDVDKLDADLIKKISLLRRNAFAAPYKKAFEAQKQGQETPLMVVHYRDAEAFFVQAQPDRVTVIFSTEFKEEQDRIIGKVFLQEFVDARRQPSTQNAPQVLYSNRDPPLELQGVAGLKDSENMGYVTFVLFPRHFAGDKAENCISKIELFRDYLHYHIKCSKAYTHSRMRLRVADLLKVLNRAKPEQKGGQKTITGKTFVRSV